MISKDEQRVNIRAEQEKKIPFEITAAKRVLEGLVLVGTVCAAKHWGPEVAQHIDSALGFHEPLKNVADLSNGEKIVYGAAIAEVAVAWYFIERYAMKIYGKLRKE